MRYINNTEVANILYEMGEHLEAREDSFRARAFLNAAEIIRNYDAELYDAYAQGGVQKLMEISGIGRGLAERIEELFTTGTIQDYKKLKEKMPVNMRGLTAIEGVGPKMVAFLYKKLRIKSIGELETAARAKKIQTLPGFGEKSEQNILRGIEFLKRSGGRAVLGFIMPRIREIEKRIRALRGVKYAALAGSARRKKETIGDIDMLVVSAHAKSVMDFVVSMKEVAGIHARGITKSSVRLSDEIDLDVRVVEERSFGAALSYFTGSKKHNVALRELAIKKGWKLNEYGLFSAQRGRDGEKRAATQKKVMIAGATEEEIYKKLGLAYIEPELREMAGEVEAAIRQVRGKQPGLPNLISYNDLRGDLQVQTDWSDGKASIESMAREAKKRGLSYIAITDHTKRLTVANGLDEKRLHKQMREVDAVQKKMGNTFKVLKGTECDILKNGSLDISDGALAKLDVVGASVHSHFNLSREEQTKRIIRAIENPHVDILFHPTGRVINRRDVYDVDMATIITAAKRTNTILEIDAFPDRLDLKDEYIRKCVEGGVIMSIDSDAHEASHFQYLEFGIAQARRGWAEKKDIINTKNWKEMIRSLK